MSAITSFGTPRNDGFHLSGWQPRARKDSIEDILTLAKSSIRKRLYSDRKLACVHEGVHIHSSHNSVLPWVIA